MFGIGDKVVCIKNQAENVDRGLTLLVVGQVYEVEAVLPAGTVISDCGSAVVIGDCIGVGVECSLTMTEASARGVTLKTSDIWGIDCFRKVQKRDISESLSELIDLFDKAPSPIVALT